MDLALPSLLYNELFQLLNINNASSFYFFVNIQSSKFYYDIFIYRYHFSLLIFACLIPSFMCLKFLLPFKRFLLSSCHPSVDRQMDNMYTVP